MQNLIFARILCMLDFCRLKIDHCKSYQFWIFEIKNTTSIKSKFISRNWTYIPPLYTKQEAMENFVFPDEIKTKIMKMSKLNNILYVP